MTTFPPSPAQGETAGVSEERLGELRQYVCTLWRQCRANPRPQVGEESMLEDLLTFIDGARQQLADSAHEVERLNAANAAMRELAAVTAWNTGMDMWNHKHQSRFDAREIGAACAAAIRALAPTSHDPVRSAGETRPVPERGKCETCDGSGLTATGPPMLFGGREYEKCAKCKGTGDCAQGGSPADPERGRCPTCGGSGKVKEWREPHWPVGPGGNSLGSYEIEKPCPDCPAGATSSIDYAQRVGHEKLKADCAQPERPCTCHPDDNPPRPCPRKYALSDCRTAVAQPERQGAVCSDCKGTGKFGRVSDCYTCQGIGRVPSPPPTAGPDGPSDIVAGLHEILPEFTSDEDGRLCIEWYGGKASVLTVTIDDAKIWFSAATAPGITSSAVWELGDPLPQPFIGAYRAIAALKGAK